MYPHSTGIRNIQKHVLGFSTDWSAVIKKIQWFSSLSKTQQKEEQRRHSQLPRFERNSYETNIKFLIERQELLRATAVSSSLVVASSLASLVMPVKIFFLYNDYLLVLFGISISCYCYVCSSFYEKPNPSSDAVWNSMLLCCILNIPVDEPMVDGKVQVHNIQCSFQFY